MGGSTVVYLQCIVQDYSKQFGSGTDSHTT